MVLYLDDGIVAVKGKEKAMQESKRVQSELLEACLIVNNVGEQEGSVGTIGGGSDS